MMTTALELARNAVNLDNANEVRAAANAYAQSIALLDEVIDRGRREQPPGLSPSVNPQEEELVRLKNIVGPAFPPGP